MPGRLSHTLGAKEVENMLANDQPRFFATMGELDWYSRSHRHWIDDLDLRVDDRVLEVGCATGSLTSYLAGSGLRVTGLDRSRKMIDRARADHPQLNLSVGDATALPYDDDAFDAVVAASVINVVDDPKQVLSEMHRVCVPGGTVSILVPSSDFTDEHLEALIEKLGLKGFSQAALMKWHRGPIKKSRTQLKDLFRSVNLKPVVTHTYLEGMLLGVSAAT
jgi:ubiquinone/menaquinone biosynthesis C-methylase UbiE